MTNKGQIYDKQRTNVWQTKNKYQINDKYMTNKRQIYDKQRKNIFMIQSSDV